MNVYPKLKPRGPLRHATPRHATPRHATPRHATALQQSAVHSLRAPQVWAGLTGCPRAPRWPLAPSSLVSSMRPPPLHPSSFRSPPAAWPRTLPLHFGCPACWLLLLLLLLMHCITY